MSINVSNLIIKLQQKISTSDNEEILLYYSKALQQLRSGTINTVNRLSDLPSSAENKGKMFLVKNEKEIYWSAGVNGTWVILGDFYPQLFSWGRGGYGQLGIGTATSASSPVREISSSKNWCAVSTTHLHSAAVKTDGTLWAWGNNELGQLGDGTVTCRSSPVREISSSTNWCVVSAGSQHSAAVKTDGTLWVWGWGLCGRLGDNTTVNKCSPVREISSSTNWCVVSAGSQHSAAVKTDGTLWSWGLGTCGRLGDGTAQSKCSPVRERSSSTNWCTVSSGSDLSTAIKTDGTLWSWGKGPSGQLGDGTVVDKSSPVREISSSTTWCTVSVGFLHSGALKTDGTLWAWGSNTCGSFGDGASTNRCSPVREITSSTNWCTVSAGCAHAAAVKTDGTLWAWGSNTCGGIGDGTVIDRSSPVREISSSTNWCAVTIGCSNSLALKFVET